MRPIKILLALAALVAGMLAIPGPAKAGGWAVTYLDPLPGTFEAGRGYTIGFWVLQHGSHPYEGALGETGLKLVDEQGKATTFTGVRLPEPAHYAAAVAIPRNGRLRLIAVQGIFAEYMVGTLTVPGRLALAPTPTPMSFTDGHAHEWGLIRPPVAVAAEMGSVASTSPAPRAAAAPSRQGLSLWMMLSVAGAVVVVTLLLLRRPALAMGRRVWRYAGRTAR